MNAIEALGVSVGSLAAFALVGALAVSRNRRRYARRVEREMRALLAVAHVPGVVSEPVELPAPVARYRDLAVGSRAPVRTLTLRHGGTFRMRPTGGVLPIRGTQLFTADPPGFVWTGCVGIVPGVWVDARDMSVAGVGSMRVMLDDTVTVVDAHGPTLDQGAALRLLAEMPWYPTALFDPRTVAWSAIDASHARATLRVGAQSVTGVFEFGPDGLPVRMTAERYMDDVLRPWGGVYRDWRTVSGMRVPFEAEVSWELETGSCTYAHWRVDSMTFDAAPG